MEIEKSGREASEAEKRVLAAYCGFGGIKCILKSPDKDSDWKARESSLRALVAKLHGVLRAEGQSEYRRLLSSLKNSVLTSFYTPDPVVGAIAGALNGAGVSAVRFLDPSAGIGIFLSRFLKEGRRSVAFEKDLLTGKILKALHPKAEVRVEGFENIEESYDGYFDLVASNIPFCDVPVYDARYLATRNSALKKSLNTVHSYFFAKGLDALREGGVMAFITSQSILNAPCHKELREMLMNRASLVSAIRLPDDLFASEANTEVGTDLVVLQKNGGKSSLSDSERLFIECRELFEGYFCNGLFDGDRSRIAANKTEFGTNPYGNPALIHSHEEGIDGAAADIFRMLEEDLKLRYDASLLADKPSVTPEIAEEEKPQDNDGQMSFFDFIAQTSAMTAGAWETPSMAERPYDGKIFRHHRDGSYAVDGKGQVGILKNPKGGEAVFLPKALIGKDRERVKLYVALRDCYEELYESEALEQKENAQSRKTLKEAYFNFIARFGQLNARSNAKAIMEDPGGRSVLSLEREEDGKWVMSDIFERPVSFCADEVSNVDTPEEAMFASLNSKGQIDIGYMARLYGTSSEEICRELRGKIYYNPLLDAWETAGRFASGNVLEKRRRIEEWAARNGMTANIADSIKVLQASAPRRITFDELDFNFGERWIDIQIYSDFASEFFGVPVNIEYSPRIDKFFVTASSLNAKITDQYSVKDENSVVNGISLMEHALENTVPELTKKVVIDGEEKTVRNGEAIQLANSKIDEIRNGFVEWLKNRPESFKEELTNRYNELFNCYVRSKYDGSYMTLPGLNLSNLRIEKPYRSQLDALSMILQNGGGIVDHEVGTGKTLIICMAAHEMKRLGLANKPLVIAMKSNVHDIAATYRKAYPGARILYPGKGDFTPKNRTRIINDMKNNDYEAIILSHEQFVKIPQSLEFQRQIAEDELDSVAESLNALERSGESVSGKMRTGLEKRKLSLETRLKKIADSIAKRSDDVADFRMLGIDHILVDESHSFKNLQYTTRHSRVAGLGNPDGSQKALNLLIAIRTIQERTGRDLGATFFSGTTVSNSLTELYLLFKYLRPRELERQKIFCFDAWAAIYAKKTVDFEFSMTNEIVSRERFRYFIKVPELAAFYNEITDYRRAEDVGVDRPKMNQRLVNSAPTKDQEDYIKKLIEFARTADGEVLGLPPLSYNERRAWMLIVSDKARKTSLDMRMIDADRYGDDPANKASICAANIAKYYRKYDNCQGTQFVFSDIGTYQPGKWNIYSEIKRKLVEDHNIPEYEIRFIQECRNDAEKKKTIDAVNKGWIRVLFGSTGTLGTGVNAQERAVAIHHLDIPWRPSDYEQRNGRAVRKGNEAAKNYANNTVDVFVYATDKTSDGCKFGILHNKQLFISQLKSGTLGIRTIDEGSMSEDGSMSYAEWMAELSGNQDLMKKAKLEKRISVLESELRTYNKNMSYSRYKLEEKAKIKKEAETVLARIRSDMDAFDKNVRRDGNGEALNPVALDGCILGDSESVGKKLGEIASELGTVGRDREIGELYGFKLIVKTEIVSNGFEYVKANRFYVQGEHRYSYNNGIMAKDPKLASRYFLNALSRMPKIAAEYEKKILESSRDMPMLSNIVSAKWGKEDELQKLKIEHSALERKIQLELKDKNIKNDHKLVKDAVRA